MNHILILPFLELISGLLGFYQLLIIVAVIVNLLAAFNILNTYNRGVFVLINALNRFTDPVLYQIRRVIPTMGGLDFSPVIAIFLIHVLQNIIRQLHIYLS
jgi:YggT family protein